MSINDGMIRTTALPSVEPAIDVVVPGQTSWIGWNDLDLDKRLSNLST